MSTDAATPNGTDGSASRDGATRGSSCVFGPVPSRRLGRSLGVDLVPFKTCSYDCVYCQLGRTTLKTVQTKSWLPIAEIMAELEDELCCQPDYITLGGSGEPTLHEGIGELIDRIKAITEIPVAVLTNGSLLWREEVRSRLCRADVIIPSLDAGDEGMLQAVNRPHAALSFQQLVAGLIALRQQFRGQVWLEVFLLPGLTTKDSEVAKLVTWVDRIGPDRVQLNTIARPTREGRSVGVSRARMAAIANMFTPTAEIISGPVAQPSPQSNHLAANSLLEMLRRRPCSIDGAAAGLGVPRAEVAKCADDLAADGSVEKVQVEGRTFYRAKRPLRCAETNRGEAQ